MKAQISIEFFVLFLILLFIFTFFFSVSTLMKRHFDGFLAIERSEIISLRVARLANSVLIAGNGTNAKITIPKNYSISYRPRSIVVNDTSGVSESSSIFTNKTNISSVNKQTIVVSNLNGEVRIIGS